MTDVLIFGAPMVCFESLEPITVGCESLASDATDALILFIDSNCVTSVCIDPLIFILSARRPVNLGFYPPAKGFVPDLLITAPPYPESIEFEVLEILSLYYDPTLWPDGGLYYLLLLCTSLCILILVRLPFVKEDDPVTASAFLDLLSIFPSAN